MSQLGQGSGAIWDEERSGATLTVAVQFRYLALDTLLGDKGFQRACL